ncbi:hypothetical protein MCOR25_007982 [Pyricularia grisea]|uniref:Rhamnogalacturonase A/B/Epimerase-like pectate lyase domain-containing protein n=1 Tax=Pyricularia grisea TaxID=148305 RepID=A0A6P8BC29_PYRGI|nr:uncharacterized protein PgNI_05091 [Pyricularia grisea]KAI6356028.1 hypothetical protein MCOR25_007982 [Pyricularia grisea]TLD13411.1 hypothetical protein PgNI_05091 [Pyricularia grisea]
MHSHSFNLLSALLLASTAAASGSYGPPGNVEVPVVTVVVKSTITTCTLPKTPPPPCSSKASTQGGYSGVTTSSGGSNTSKYGGYNSTVTLTSKPTGPSGVSTIRTSPGYGNGTTIRTSTTTGTSTSTSASSTSTSTPLPGCGSDSYWLANIKHQGFAPYAPNPSNYTVFRSVKEFGAKGDGKTDDTAAINRAISEGGRCGPGSCNSTTTTPGLIYFPPGTYRITSPIINYYFTQIYGSPLCMPVIKPSANFTGAWVLDANQYQAGGILGWGSTNVFWRQVRNLVIDMTDLPVAADVAGIHWPSSQATSLQNIHVKMAKGTQTKHFGMFIEEGSGGYLGDMVFEGGLDGMRVGNQQFTMRNLTFIGAQTAINQLWSWGWTYSGITIKDCKVGLNISNSAVGSVVLIDSEIINTPIGVVTSRKPPGQENNPAQSNTLMLENIRLSNVPTAISGPNNSVLLAGSASSTTIAGWGQGNRYTASSGPTAFQGQTTPFSRPAALTSGTNFYERSRPSYAEVPASQFVSVKSEGAKGDGKTDDTAAIIAAVNKASSSKKVLFFDYGMYVVTSTIYIPAGMRITGEALPVIISQGDFFNSMSSPKPVVQVGKPGETGAAVEWSDMVVSTRGQQMGAILIEWNLASTTPSGMWDVHTRIGGFAGSNLSAAECPKTPATKIDSNNLDKKCIAAFMSMHIAASASNLLNENCWLWVADHDAERDAGLVQITVYAGRGLLVESKEGKIWLWGTGVEHHQMYEYQFVSTQNIFAGQVQTETAYYQPNPDATLPFPVDSKFSDPTFEKGQSGWGFRAVDSKEILVYGAGLYSFFDNYNVTCAQEGQGQTCQSRIMDVENSPGVKLYNLNTVGIGSQITLNGRDVARWQDNKNGFVNTVAVFTS